MVRACMDEERGVAIIELNDPERFNTWAGEIGEDLVHAAEAWWIEEQLGASEALHTRTCTHAHTHAHMHTHIRIHTGTRMHT